MAEGEEDLKHEIDGEDYYAFLNVPRNASPDDIHRAYRRFTRIYHPDKHTDPEQKQEAEMLFDKTRRAYGVLSDPKQRAIYDNIGAKGLEEMKSGSGWEVMQNVMTPEEIREKYEELAKEREENKLNTLTKQKGILVVQIDATNLFDPDNKDRFSGGIAQISSINIHQSADFPITLRDVVLISGDLTTDRGLGYGSLSLSLRKFLLQGNEVQFSVGVGNGLVYSLNGRYNISKQSSVTLQTNLVMKPKGLECALVSGVGTRLTNSLYGYLKFQWSQADSAMSTSLVHKAKSYEVALTLQLGIINSHLAVEYAHRFLDETLSLRISAKYGTLGASLSYGAEKKVTKYSTIGASVSFGLPMGVRLRVKLVRANQTYIFPIHLCEEVLPAPVFYATVAPLVTWIVVKKLVFDPYKKGQEEKEKEKKRQMMKNQMKQQQKEAQAAVSLMSTQYERVRSEEEARRGLVIVEAVYGKLISSEGAPMENPDASHAEMIYVTIPLQCLVNDSKLMLHEVSKSQLPGFYDPCVGDEKQLMVRYLFHSQLHEVTIKDDEVLRIPKTSHRLNTT